MRIAVSLALFGILKLLSHTSSSFLDPLTSLTFAKRVETGIDQHVAANTLSSIVNGGASFMMAVFNDTWCQA